MNETVLLVMGVFLVGIGFFGIIQRRKQLRKIAADPGPTLSDLGYEEADFEDPYPFLLKVSRLHGKTKRPIGVYRRQIPEGEMYLYGINMKSPTSGSVDIRTKITIVSPSIDLPHLSIAPIWKQKNDKNLSVSKIVKRIFPTPYSRRDLKTIRLGIDEEFENTHLIQANDEAKARDFLTSSRLKQLKSFKRQYVIECNESDLSIADPAQKKQDWEYLVQTARDAQAICRMLSSA